MISLRCSQLGDVFDSLCFGVVVFVLETSAFNSMSLHFVVVISANSINVLSGSKLVEQFLGIVELEHLLDAVKVLSDVVLVLEDA